MIAGGALLEPLVQRGWEFLDREAGHAISSFC
jgi:hypothetical protein